MSEREAPTEAQAEMIATFLSITQPKDPNFDAQSFLSECKWNLENSINQYMAISDEMPGTSSAAAGAGAGPAFAGLPAGHRDMLAEAMAAGDAEEDQALKEAIAASQREHEGMSMDEEMDEDDDDYDDEDDSAFEPPQGASSVRPDGGAGGGSASKVGAGSSRGAAGAGSARAPPGVGAEDGTVVEPFRNFSVEGMAVPVSAAAGESKDAGMEMLFPPPADLIFQGNFDALRKHAESEKKYCLVNIQKQDEFASHALNRDTWKADQVCQVVKSSFIFWQQQFGAISGQHYLSLYASHDLPIVDIIDPMTGAMLDRIVGYTTPEDMIERLTRFLDSHTWGKMGKALPAQPVAMGISQAQYHSIDGPGGADKRSRMSLENEDAALDAAIAASLQDSAVPPAGCVEDDASRVRRQRSDSAPHSAYSDSLRVAQEVEFEQSLQQDEEKERLKRQVEEEKALEAALLMSQEEEKKRVLQEKEAALPPEPESDGPGVVSVMLRMPDGSRKSRRFMGTDKLQAVHDFMHLGGVEASEHTVATSFPRKVLEDAEASLESLGIQGQTMLNVERK
eukprot:CAMPEP_0173387314 /NCGR_PEP_ID=MMETSP1356-20130122/9829_1 /TAXON_ID=77927 ORGANISM="Hemiselmis virescens, Strain PCC157" /NCGR_SAMPLE_ID=MMETSP1356 /ASSEMBLY_ACC=CAM_ASM_000847 /LENGTH=564 /DNA_ID=CAMNT_0014343877 /DNA_START=277 /DNA_END=1971 /DNA_ORIENTATION=+